MYARTFKASNEFFYQFPNCLAYENLDDCVTKIQYALENEPEPLQEHYRRILSWEGATERLFEASGITRKEDKTRKENKLHEEEMKAARFHVETAKKSQMVTKFFGARIVKSSSTM